MKNAISRFDRIRSAVGFALAPLVFITIIILPTPETFTVYASKNFSGLKIEEILEITYSMKIISALLLTMIILWLSEAIPIPVTALLPAVILTFFNVKGVNGNEIFDFTGKIILANYANPIIYLFLSGFLIARSMQKWNLDRRITYSILSIKNLASNPSGIILALLSISAFLSMWISNTATTAMLLPIVMGIVNIVSKEDSKNFPKSLALAIAYGSSIGGIATLIGTPPNGICVSILKSSLSVEINFLDWLKIGLPISLILIPIVWIILIKVFPMDIKKIDNGNTYTEVLKKNLGPISKGEKLTLLAFFILLVLWTTNPFWKYLMPTRLFYQLKNFDENLIALGVAISLFFLPVNWKDREFVLAWKDSKFIDWGTLILFGGGIALSEAMFKTGFAGWIANSVINLIGNTSPLILVLNIVIFIIFLTEVTSNTAVTSMMVPILLSISLGVGVDGKLLAISAALAASMAFMLPVATPPNAIVYGSGYVKITDMLKTGIMLNIISWLIIVFGLYIFGDLLMGIVNFNRL